MHVHMGPVGCLYFLIMIMLTNTFADAGAGRARLTAPPPRCLLQGLDLSDNALTGTIPGSWALPDSLLVSVRL